MNARRIGILAANDVLRIVKDRQTFVWMLLMPIAFMWFFGQQGSGGDPRISLAVEDRDGGWLARAIVDELDGEQLAVVEIDRTATDGQAPKRRRTLILPAGLTTGALGEDAQVLRLELEPGSDLGADKGAEVHIQRALLRVEGRLLEMVLAAAPKAERAARHAELRARPPLATLRVETAGAGEPVPSGYAQSVPGMLTMTVLMMTLIYGGVFLVIEKEQGLLRRQATLPVTRGEIIVGKIVGRLMIAALQIAVLLGVGHFAFGVRLGGSPLGLLLLTGSYAVAVAGLSTLLGALLKTTEQASLTGWLGSMVLAGFGGCWWPFELMPEWLRLAAHALPTTWAMQGFHALISFGRGVEGVWVACLVLLGFGAVFAALAARRLTWE